jgi:O-antigen ligase
VLQWVLHNLSSKFKIQSSKFSLSSVFYLLSSALGLAALYLSFSRAAWVVGGLGILGVLGQTLRKKALSLSSFYSLLPSAYSLSFLRRAELNWIALHIIKDYPLLGVGLNNFTVRMDEYGRVSGWVRFLQPVHNFYLLVAAEIGLIGLGVFIGLLFLAFRLLLKSRNFLLLISLTQIVLFGFFDHYFWTIQQTSLLFWLIVGLVFSCRFKYNQTC